MKYTIYNKSKNITYELHIDEIFTLIKENINDEYYKFINGDKIQINNNIVLNTQFICHRINTIEELNEIPKMFGVELDLRDDKNTGNLILSHDPFICGENFENYLETYNHNTLILNIKSERVELDCLHLMKKYNISNYLFLDSNLPMIYLLNNSYNNTNIFCRFSEFEPIESYYHIKNMISWIWVDCFTYLPLTYDTYSIFKNDGKKICIVSPELQKQPEKISIYRELLITQTIIPNAICCKLHNIILWI